MINFKAKLESYKKRRKQEEECVDFITNSITNRTLCESSLIVKKPLSLLYNPIVSKFDNGDFKIQTDLCLTDENYIPLKVNYGNPPMFSIPIKDIPNDKYIKVKDFKYPSGGSVVLCEFNDKTYEILKVDVFDFGDLYKQDRKPIRYFVLEF